MNIERWVSVNYTLHKKVRDKDTGKKVKEFGITQEGYTIAKDEPFEIHKVILRFVLTAFEFYANVLGVSPEALQEQVDEFKKDIEQLKFIENK